LKSPSALCSGLSWVAHPSATTQQSRAAASDLHLAGTFCHPAGAEWGRRVSRNWSAKLLNQICGVAARSTTGESRKANQDGRITTGESRPANHGRQTWLRRVHDGLAETDRKYPFLAYGPDWLAFPHLVIAIAFIGPLLDPVLQLWRLGCDSPAPLPALRQRARASRLTRLTCHFASLQ
jgi:hypothetical protein